MKELASTGKNEWKFFQNSLNLKFKDEIARICCSLSNSMNTFEERSNSIRWILGNLTPVKISLINKPWKWMPYAERQLVCLYLFQAFMRLVSQRMTCLHSAVSRLAMFYKLYTYFLLANKWSKRNQNWQTKFDITSQLSSEIRCKIVPIALRVPYVCSQPS